MATKFSKGVTRDTKGILCETAGYVPQAQMSAISGHGLHDDHKHIKILQELNEKYAIVS